MSKHASHPPASAVHEQGGAPPQVDPYRTFHALQARSTSSEIVFRVHSPASASSLLWTGDLSTSGFACPNANLAVLTPGSYTSVLLVDPPWDRPTPLFRAAGMTRGREGRARGGAVFGGRGDGSENRLGWYLSHTITDHIHGKTRQTCISMPSDISERPTTPEDDHSPWISASTSLEWCLWEITRRLAASSTTESVVAGEMTIGLAAVKYNPLGPTMSTRTPTPLRPPSSLIDEEPDDNKPTKESEEKVQYASQELHVDPLPHLSSALGAQRREFSIMMRETYEDAMTMARTSGEVLYYGRIFAESIERNWGFTRSKMGFALPPEFWAAFPAASEHSSGSFQAQSPRQQLGNVGRYKAAVTLASGLHSSFLHGVSTVPADPIDRHPASTSSKQIAQSSSTSLRRDVVEDRVNWLERLVWDPREDDFRSAMSKVHRRRMELAREDGHGSVRAPSSSSITGIRDSGC